MQKITPCLWFDTQAEEAATFYVSLFKNANLGRIARYDKPSAAVSGKPEGSVMTVDFELDGQSFVALNGGPDFPFTEAISLTINCRDQDEVDHFWERLTDGGEEGPCGWLKDRYGVSWQVVPTVLNELLQDPDREKAQRVMAAMLQMKKIDIAALRDAYEASPANP